jgi:hypothetical protein
MIVFHCFVLVSKDVYLNYNLSEVGDLGRGFICTETEKKRRWKENITRNSSCDLWESVFRSGDVTDGTGMGAISAPGRHQYELWTRRDGRTLVVPAQRKLVASTGFTWYLSGVSPGRTKPLYFY